MVICYPGRRVRRMPQVRHGVAVNCHVAHVLYAPLQTRPQPPSISPNPNPPSTRTPPPAATPWWPTHPHLSTVGYRGRRNESPCAENTKVSEIFEMVLRGQFRSAPPSSSSPTPTPSLPPPPIVFPSARYSCSVSVVIFQAAVFHL